MQILVLSDNFPPLSGAGAEKIAYYICQEYIRAGHTVSVITTNSSIHVGSIKTLSYKGLTICQIGSNYNNRYTAYFSLYNRKVLKSIKSILNRRNFELAHLHNIHFHISYGVISLLKKHVKKCILTAHDAMSVDYGKFTQGINSNDLSDFPYVKKKINPMITFWNYKRSYNPFRNLVIKHYLSKLDRIVTVSNSQRKLLTVNGIKNTETIRNGIPLLSSAITQQEVELFKSSHGIDKNENVLLWAGRLSKLKGSEQVINLLETLIRKNYKVKLLIAGGSISCNGFLDDYIVSTGWIDEGRMQLAYEVSDIVLVPSICYDMFPTVVLESMRQGVPVIAGCFGGAKEAVINEETGYIVNPFNDKAIYKSACKIINNRALANKMKGKSVEVFEDKFTIEKSVSEYLDLVKIL